MVVLGVFVYVLIDLWHSFSFSECLLVSSCFVRCVALFVFIYFDWFIAYIRLYVADFNK